MAEHAIQFTVNGQSHSGVVRGAQDARRLPARGLRAHRHAPRLRARRVRRVHDPRRRRRGAVVPDVRGAGRRRRHHHHRGHRSRPTARSARCRRRSARPTVCSAGSARPGFVVSVHAFLEDNPSPTPRRDPGRALRQPLPLHRLPGDHQGRADRRGDDEHARTRDVSVDARRRPTARWTSTRRRPTASPRARSS